MATCISSLWLLLHVVVAWCTVSSVSGDWIDDVKGIIDNTGNVPNAAVIIGNLDGRLLTHTKGTGTLTKRYLSASSIKWPVGAIILRLVEAQVLSLDDNPQDYLSYWSDDANEEISKITLTQLLSYTSGFKAGPTEGEDGPPPCISDGTVTLQDCVEDIYNNGTYFQYTPGTTYYYGPIHAEVAAAMAEEATGLTWENIAKQYMFNGLGMDDTDWVVASKQNPRVAGGAMWSAVDCEQFLKAMLNMSEYLPTTYETMVQDHTKTGEVTIEYTPSPDGADGKPLWHYGLSVWRVCDDASWTTACEENVKLLATVGAFGFYGWVNVELGYYGVIATSLLVNGPTKVDFLVRQLRPTIEGEITTTTTATTTTKITTTTTKTTVTTTISTVTSQTKTQPLTCDGTPCNTLKCAVVMCPGNNELSYGCTGKSYINAMGNCSCVTPESVCVSTTTTTVTTTTATNTETTTTTTTTTLNSSLLAGSGSNITSTTSVTTIADTALRHVSHPLSIALFMVIGILGV